MKNVYLFVMLFITGFNSFGQGVDLIIMLENPYDADCSHTQSNNMFSAAVSLKAQFLACNPLNRVAWVHYKTTAIKVCPAEEYNFTNFATVPNPGACESMGMCYDAGKCNLHSAIKKVNEALHSTIQDPTALVSNPSNSLVIYIFKSGARTSSDPAWGDFIVNPNSSAFNSDDAFLEYTKIKTEFNATIMMTVSPANNDARKAFASVASVGGSYYGAIEGYAADPQGNGTLPRYLLETNSLYMSPAQIQTAVSNICAVQKPCLPDLTLVSPRDNSSIYYPTNYQSSNSITATTHVESTSRYHAGNTIVLKPGFYATGEDVDFRGYIEGCSYDFENSLIINGNENQRLTATNAEVIEDIFTLSPNPATDNVTVSSDKEILSITVISLDGITYFRGVPNSTSYELNISNYPKGIYVVNVTAANGETEIKKLIKN